MSKKYATATTNLMRRSYFVQDEYSGVSAFIRKEDAEAARSVRMLSVGVLVPEVGRMGKSFLYAQELKGLATLVPDKMDQESVLIIYRTLIDNPTDTIALEVFWDKHKSNNEASQPQQEDQSPTGYQKPRGLSVSTLLSPGTQHSLPAHHPALNLPETLKSFGPLIFPIFRSVLSHKRVLILGEAPVELMCDTVYNLSILSSLSRTTEALLPSSYHSGQKVRPLFNVGIADIDFLESLTYSWIACTTDDVLATKPHLFDVLVLLPTSTTSHKFSNSTYPKVINSTPELTKALPRDGVRATQRDARRFVALKTNLNEVLSGAEVAVTEDSETESRSSEDAVIADRKEAVEPLPWSVIAYTSLIWWASAGDSRSGLLEAEELAQEQDEALLTDVFSEDGATKEVAIVAYFHKLSALLFTILSNAVNRQERTSERYRDEDTNEDGDNQALLDSDHEDLAPIEISEEDVRTMGLDIWSESDRAFITSIIESVWKRKAVVRSGVIECCGIRLL